MITCPPLVKATVWLIPLIGIKVPLMRRLAINTPPSHCGGVLAAEQVHCELAGMRSAVKTLPLTAKFKFSTIACDRLCSKAACVVASRLAVVRVPPNKLPDGSDLKIKPPVEGRFPVSLRVPFTPETVPVTDVARPLKVMTAGVGVGVGFPVPQEMPDSAPEKITSATPGIIT